MERPDSGLNARLREQRMAHLCAVAETIRDWPLAVEREEAARRLIREIMAEHALRRISLDERNAVLAILDFVQPICESETDAETLERLDTYQSALQQSLAEPPATEARREPCG